MRSLLCLSPGPELPVCSSFTYTSGSGIAESSGNSMLIFGGTVRLFSTEFAPFYLLPSNVQGFQFLHLLVDACHFPLIFFSYSHTIELKWYLVILICICLMTNDWRRK